jgi:beta-lactam-binding protein with PASTA domain/tRNA A-37 threonylcarbamoyl transferase component Bud32
VSTAVPQLLGGRYEIGDLLGRGGMAEVHIGRDSRLGRSVAVKMLRPDLARDPSFQARFRREAHSAASLNHPAVVAVYDTGEDEHAGNPVPYIVMEYVEGSTLRDLMASGRKLMPERALEIVDGVLNALSYSHQHGIVHRDIKPANVMLTGTGDVKVMDFGIARALADQSATLTATSAVIGTAQYLSPEQARGEQVDARSDIYSTGCLLYELLTGRPPFVGDSPVSVAYQHVREDAAPPSTYDPDVPPAVDAVVMRALTKDREARYQDADEMRTDIARALAGRSVAAAPLPTAATQRVKPVAAGTATFPVLPDNQRDRPDNRGGRALGYALLGLAVIAVFVIAAVAGKALLDSNSPKKVAVADVVGKTQADAERALTTQHLTVKPIIKENNDAQPVGRVFDQIPESGTQLKEGQGVTLKVSLGVKEVAVPNLINLSVDEAANQLREVGLKLGDRRSVASDQERNLVTKSTPKSGKTVDVGSSVDVEVASGQNKVPNVKGQSGGQARSILEQAGFTVVEQTEESGEGDPGDVIKQTPGAGENARLNSTVTITTATAPPVTPPPVTPPPVTPPPAG